MSHHVAGHVVDADLQLPVGLLIDHRVPVEGPAGEQRRAADADHDVAAVVGGLVRVRVVVPD
jgi:hypothetical protein